MSLQCSSEFQTCWDGSYVIRDPLNNCEFGTCPFQSGALYIPPFQRLCNCIIAYNFCPQNCPSFNSLSNSTLSPISNINITDCYEIELQNCGSIISGIYSEFCHDCQNSPPLPPNSPLPPDNPALLIFQTGQQPLVPPPTPPQPPQSPPPLPPIRPSPQPPPPNPHIPPSKSPPLAVPTPIDRSIQWIVTISLIFTGFFTLIIGYVVLPADWDTQISTNEEVQKN